MNCHVSKVEGEHCPRQPLLGTLTACSPLHGLLVLEIAPPAGSGRNTGLRATMADRAPALCSANRKLMDIGTF